MKTQKIMPQNEKHSKTSTLSQFPSKVISLSTRWKEHKMQQRQSLQKFFADKITKKIKNKILEKRQIKNLSNSQCASSVSPTIQIR